MCSNVGPQSKEEGAQRVSCGRRANYAEEMALWWRLRFWGNSEVFVWKEEFVKDTGKHRIRGN